MGLSNELWLWSWEFLLLLQPPQVCIAQGFKALFLHIGTLSFAVCLTPQLFLLVYLHANVETPDLPAALAMSPPYPGCLSLPLLPVWMNVSSWTPWLSEFHTVWFSGSCGYFLFLNFLSFWLCEEAQCIYLHLCLGWKQKHTLYFLESTFFKTYFVFGWCGSVDWVPACKPEGCQFDSQLGCMPAVRARSPVGAVQEATTHCFSPSLSSSLPLSLKINKWNLWKKHTFCYKRNISTFKIIEIIHCVFSDSINVEINSGKILGKFQIFGN